MPAAEQAERERLAAAAADAVRQALAGQDCGRGRAAGLCEACDHRRQTEALIGEAGLLAAAGSADLSDAGSIAAAVAGARTAIGDSAGAAWREFLEITDVAAPEADPQAAADATRSPRFRPHSRPSASTGPTPWRSWAVRTRGGLLRGRHNRGCCHTCTS
ncbi:hypothetical protein [Streptomyces sp. WAC 06725]|uniref:hypothetical protein n=1 Tax=Streptomyces sp. WAC 06725 TaxID=2203209 RepID=UPI00163CC265|nr:hypothetical protein [Streptomyces sp. WAC 06725]